MTLIGPAVPTDGDDLRALVTQWRALRDLDDPAALIQLLPEPTTSPGEGPLARAGFVVKANIDVAGAPTTAGLRHSIRTPNSSAAVVRRLVAAGATPLALANLDQLATGLVGTRSPFGIPINPIDPTSIPGGSSSGSAVTVCRGSVPFALGTDTAGSGRVPAALTRTVGLKPTLGWLPTAGIVPAIAGFDAVSIHALCIHDAWEVALAAAGPDPSDPWSRTRPDSSQPSSCRVIGTPADPVLDALCEPATAAAHRRAMTILASLGHEIRHLDLENWFETARSLYGGPWVAARDAAFGDLIDREPDGLDPTVASIVRASRRWTAADAYRSLAELAEHRRRAQDWWADVGLLAFPTVPFRPTVAEVARDPIAVNERLGTFTNAANLLDTCAVSMPIDSPDDGLPRGLMLVGPAWADHAVAVVAAAFEAATPERRLGATRATVADLPRIAALTFPPSGPTIHLVVVGAHLRGQPLHHQLQSIGARFVRTTTTAANYRLYHLNESQPPKPGLARADTGAAVIVEEYDVPLAGFGRFVASVPPPLAIGTVELADGTTPKGFVCEPLGIRDSVEITSWGGWVAYLEGRDVEGSSRAPAG